MVFGPHGRHGRRRARRFRASKLEELDEDDMRFAKRFGLSDVQIAHLTGSDELSVRAHRKALGVVPAFKTVDTCAAETPSKTAYHYKTYDTCERGRSQDQEARDDPRRGPEPHRPGHRVRLLLRACKLRACRRRLRDHHGQLQP